MPRNLESENFVQKEFKPGIEESDINYSKINGKESNKSLEGETNNTINKKVEINLAEFEEETETLKKEHPEAFKQLEEIANANGFKKLLLLSKDKMHDWSVLDSALNSKTADIYSESQLLAHEKLMKEYDSEFAREAADIETKYCVKRREGETHQLIETAKEKMQGKDEEFLNLPDNEQIESFKKSIGHFGDIEAQKDIIALSKDLKKENNEKLINDYATRTVYMGFLNDGEKSLDEKGKNNLDNFIKPKIVEKISKKEKQIKNELLEAHKNKLEYSEKSLKEFKSESTKGRLEKKEFENTNGDLRKNEEPEKARALGFQKESEESLEDIKERLRFENAVRSEMKTDNYKISDKFGVIVNHLEKIAKEYGFSGGVGIEDEDKNATHSIGVGNFNLRKIGNKLVVYRPHTNRVDFGKDTLDNIKELFELDKNFAEKGLSEIIKHEKQHLEGISKKLNENEEIKIQEAIDIAVKNGNENPESLKKIIYKIADEMYAKSELTTEVQRINKNDYKNQEDFIESQAIMHIATGIAYNGIDYLNRIKYDFKNIKPHDSHFRFIKPVLQEKISKRMEEMREDLIKKQTINKDSEIKNEKNYSIKEEAKENEKTELKPNLKDNSSENLETEEKLLQEKVAEKFKSMKERFDYLHEREQFDIKNGEKDFEQFVDKFRNKKLSDKEVFDNLNELYKLYKFCKNNDEKYVTDETKGTDYLNWMVLSMLSKMERKDLMNSLEKYIKDNKLEKGGYYDDTREMKSYLRNKLFSKEYSKEYQI